MAGSMRPVKDWPNTWELHIYFGRDPERRVRDRHATFHGAPKQAERELARLTVEQDSKLLRCPRKPNAGTGRRPKTRPSKPVVVRRKAQVRCPLYHRFVHAFENPRQDWSSDHSVIAGRGNRSTLLHFGLF